MKNIKKEILQGIPCHLPKNRVFNHKISHAPKRKDILSLKEKKLAIKNALRYFPKNYDNIYINL